MKGDSKEVEQEGGNNNQDNSYEYYGFGTYLISFLLYGVYLAWAYLPEATLHAYGVTYYVARYWGIAIPVFFIVSLLTLVAVAMAYMVSTSPPLDSYKTLTDRHSIIRQYDSSSSSSGQFTKSSKSRRSNSQQSYSASNRLSNDDDVSYIDDELRMASIKRNEDSSSSTELTGNAELYQDYRMDELTDIPIHLVNACTKFDEIDM
ncbi:hypothetical protein MIR68_001040 [Amoeboaphelidium protococcarum]|nr:hypothetical protein MIR68_001040 [Amoeboaphelidium protococcarum]